MTVTGTTLPSSKKTWLIPTFLPRKLCNIFVTVELKLDRYVNACRQVQPR